MHGPGCWANAYSADSARGLVALPVESQDPLRIGLFGCALDTGNLGVSALGIAMVKGLSSTADRVECMLFDHGRGVRCETLEGGEWKARVERVGCAYSHRVWRADDLRQLLLANRAGLRRLHPRLARLGRLDAFVDLSGGDSFGDLYGGWRFRSMVAPKRLALGLARPLVLGPQTYGPFRKARHARIARGLILGAHQAWARDPTSFERLGELLGADFDPERHRCGVDVAFGLPVRAPDAGPEADLLEAWRQRDLPVLGLNLSGLLFSSEDSQRRFGLRSPYASTARRLLRVLLSEPDARVLLVPHVGPPCKPFEMDDRACRELRGELDTAQAERVVVVPAQTDPRVAKGWIGRCDWFCGTRMHAAIAALSQGVPTLGVAYSEKMAGVFATAGTPEAVVDARRQDAEGIADAVRSSLGSRGEWAAALALARPGLEAALREEFRAMVRAAEEGRQEGWDR